MKQLSGSYTWILRDLRLILIILNMSIHKVSVDYDEIKCFSKIKNSGKALIVESMITVTSWIVLQVPLMFGFALIELQAIRGLNLSNNFSFNFSTALYFITHLLGDFLLFFGVSEDHRSILSTSIISLFV